MKKYKSKSVQFISKDCIPKKTSLFKQVAVKEGMDPGSPTKGGQGLKIEDYVAGADTNVEDIISEESGEEGLKEIDENRVPVVTGAPKLSFATVDKMFKADEVDKKVSKKFVDQPEVEVFIIGETKPKTKSFSKLNTNPHVKSENLMKQRSSLKKSFTVNNG